MHSEEEQGSIIKHEQIQCDSGASFHSRGESVDLGSVSRAASVVRSGQECASTPGGVRSHCTDTFTASSSQCNTGFSQVPRLFQSRSACILLYLSSSMRRDSLRSLIHISMEATSSVSKNKPYSRRGDRGCCLRGNRRRPSSVIRAKLTSLGRWHLANMRGY